MIEITIFLIGLAIGSFLNVLADRLPRDEDVFLDRSYCDSCKKKIKNWDLVPVISYLILRGKCRFCKKKISIKYPLVELTAGLGFVFISLLYPFGIALIFYLIIFSISLVIFLSDLQYFIIPDAMVIAGIMVTFAYKLLYLRSELVTLLITGIISCLFFYFLHKITKGKGMGLGDVKLAFLMGFLLGFPAVVIAFYVSFLTGAIVGLILILIGKSGFGKHIPFGPFLILGTLLTLFYKEQLLMLFIKYLF